jgi:hypothetical protein
MLNLFLLNGEESNEGVHSKPWFIDYILGYFLYSNIISTSAPHKLQNIAEIAG